MPPAMVLDLVVSRNNNTLRAATFGSGVYQRKLERIPTISLLSLNGGEILVSGETHLITWSNKFLDAVKLEYSTNNGSTWKLIANNAPATPSNYLWTIPDVTTYEAKIRVTDASSGIASDTSDNVFSIYFAPTVLTGWNLVSIDKVVSNPLTEAVFPSAISKAFKYTNGYTQTDSISAGTGYWLKFAQPEFIDLFGDSLHSDTVNLHPGWNMIGSIAQTMTIDEFIQNPPGNIISQVFGYRNGYSTVDSLIPKRGYWIKADDQGTLVLPYAAQTLVANTKTSSVKLPQENRITIQDARGNRQDLFVADKLQQKIIDAFEMPPRPPAGIFDARFASGSMVESFSSSGINPEGFIEITGAQYPVRIDWDMRASGHGTFFLDVNGKRTSCVGAGSITMTRQSKLSVGFDEYRVSGLPSSFSMEQNYPNPFNPSTVINYTLPEQSHVTLRIFDIQGKEVLTLVNGMQEAGLKSVEVDGTNFSSGVYFYRIETSGYMATRKMLLVK
jgi:hypothetical protein